MALISSNITFCTTVWKRGVGLMWTRETSDFAYIFTFRKPRNIIITMWFVFYPIDIIFLDAKGVIIECVTYLKPFTHYTAKQKASTFIELPKGSIQKHNLTVGMRIKYAPSYLKTA